MRGLWAKLQGAMLGSHLSMPRVESGVSVCAFTDWSRLTYPGVSPDGAGSSHSLQIPIIAALQPKADLQLSSSHVTLSWDGKESDSHGVVF